MSEESESGGEGNPQSPFPATLWTLVLQASQSDENRSQEALRQLCTIYRQPVIAWLRRRGSTPADAEDFAHGFIEHLLTRNRFERFVRGQARFRSFLLGCLNGFLRDEWRKRVAEKRGGAMPHLDIADWEAGTTPDFDSGLDADFALQVHQQAMSRLEERFRSAGRQARFAELRCFVLGQDGGDSYEEVGVRLGLKTNAVKKAVFDLRDDYCEFFREAVLQTVARDAADQEMRYLLTLLAQTGGRGPA